MSAVIETALLTKYYGEQPGIIGLDLEVTRGEVFGFLGPNGAGKTTTLRLLLDLLRPTSGSASVLGLDSRRDGVELRLRVGYVPGELALCERLTGEENLRYFAALRGGVDWDWVGELAERFGVDLSRRVAGGLAGIMYLMNILAPESALLERLRPASLFSYYGVAPLSEGLRAADVAASGLTALVALALAFCAFSRRDIGA